MRQLKNILKSSTYMVLPAVAALLSGKAANAAVDVVAAPTVHAGLDKVHASVPMSGVASKHFAKMVGHSGNVQEILNNTAKMTAFQGKTAHVKYELAQNDVFVGRGATHTIVSDTAGATFVASIQASKESVAQILGNIHAKGINFIMTTPGSIHQADGSVIDVASLTLAAGQQFDGISAGKLHMHTVNADAVITKSSAATIKVADAGLVNFVAPNVAAYGMIAGVEAKNVNMVNADKTTVDLYGDGLISFEISKASADKARALAAELGAENGIMLFSTVDALNAVKSLVDTKGITQAQASMKVGRDVVLGAGYALSFLSADVRAENIAIQGLYQTNVSSTYNAKRVLVGGDWQGGNVTSAYMTNGVAEGRFTAVQAALMVPGTFTIPSAQNSFITLVDKNTTINATYKAVVWSDDTTKDFSTITSKSGIVERSGARHINAEAFVAADGASLTLFDPKNILVVPAAAFANAVFMWGSVAAGLNAAMTHYGDTDPKMVAAAKTATAAIRAAVDAAKTQADMRAIFDASIPAALTAQGIPAATAAAIQAAASGAVTDGGTTDDKVNAGLKVLWDALVGDAGAVGAPVAAVADLGAGGTQADIQAQIDLITNAANVADTVGSVLSVDLTGAIQPAFKSSVTDVGLAAAFANGAANGSGLTDNIAADWGFTDAAGFIANYLNVADVKAFAKGADGATFGARVNNDDLANSLGGGTAVAGAWALNFDSSPTSTVILNADEVSAQWGHAGNGNVALYATNDIVILGDLVKQGAAGNLSIKAGGSVYIGANIDGSAAAGGNIVIQGGVDDALMANMATNIANYGVAGTSHTSRGVKMSRGVTVTGAQGVDGQYVSISLKDNRAYVNGGTLPLNGDIILGNIVAPITAGAALQGESVFISNRTGTSTAAKGNIYLGADAGVTGISLPNDANATSPIIFQTTFGDVGGIGDATTAVVKAFIVNAAGANTPSITLLGNVNGQVNIFQTAGNDKPLVLGANLAAGGYEGPLQILLSEGFTGGAWVNAAGGAAPAPANGAAWLALATKGGVGVTAAANSTVLGLKATGGANITSLGTGSVQLADFGAAAPSYWGGSIVAPGKTVYLNTGGGRIASLSDNNVNAAINAQDLILVTVGQDQDAAATAITAGAALTRAIPVNLTGSLVGSTTAAAGTVLSFTTANNITLGSLAGVTGQVFGANGVATAAGPAALTKYFALTTTANNGSVAVFQTGATNNINVAKTGLAQAPVTAGDQVSVGANDVGAAVSLNGIGKLILDAAGGITNDADAFIYGVGAGAAALYAGALDISAFATPLGFKSGDAAFYVNTKTNTLNKSIYLKPLSAMVLGGANLNAVVAAGAGSATNLLNTGAAVTGTGNIFIDGGLNVLSLVGAATALSAVDGTILVKAGDLAGVAGASGITGSKISMIVTQDGANLATTGQIGRGNAIVITAAGTYGQALNPAVQVEAVTLQPAPGALGAAPTAANIIGNRRDIALSFQDARTFRIVGTSLGAAVDATLGTTAKLAQNGLYAQDSLISLTLAADSNLILGTNAYAGPDSETVIWSKIGGLSITQANGAGKVTVAHAKAQVQGVGLILATGGANNGIGGLDTTDGTKDLRFKFKPEGSALDVNGAAIDDYTGNFGVLTSAGYIGASYINFIGGYAAIGTLAVVAAAPGTAVTGSAINYGLKDSLGVGGIAPALLGAAGYVVGAGSTFNLGADSGVILSHTSAEVLDVSAANSWAILETPSLSYFGPDGVLAANRGDNTGRIKLENDNTLLLMVDKVGSYGDNRAGFVDNFRIKIGVGTIAAAAGNQTGFVLGQGFSNPGQGLDSAHFNVLNDNAATSILSFGNVVADGVPSWAKQNAAARLGSPTIVNYNTFVMNGNDATFSIIAGLDTDSAANIAFVGAAGKDSFTSTGNVAIDLRGPAGNLNANFIARGAADSTFSAGNLMLIAGNVSSDGADAAAFSLGTIGGYVGLNVTTAKIAATKDTAFGLKGYDGTTAVDATDAKSIAGIFAGGVSVAGVSALNFLNNSSLALESLAQATVGALTVTFTGSGNANLGTVSFAGNQNIIFNMGTGNVAIDTIQSFKMTANGVEFNANTNATQTVTLSSVADGAFDDTGVGGITFSATTGTVDLGSHTNFNKAILAVTQSKGDFEINDDLIAGGYVWDLGQGRLLNPNNKTLTISILNGDVSLTAAAIGSASNPVLISSDYDATGANTHQVILKSTGNIAANTYGVYATLIGGANGSTSNRVNYTLGGGGAGDISVVGNGDIVVTLSHNADATLSDIGGLINTAKGNVSLLSDSTDDTESVASLTVGGATTIIAGGAGNTISLAFKSLGAGVAAADFFQAENVSIKYYKRAADANNATDLVGGGRFFNAGQAIYANTVKNITLDGGAFRVFNLNGANLDLSGFASLKSITVKGQSLTATQLLTLGAATPLNLSIQGSVAWNFANGQLNGTVGSLVGTILTGVKINLTSVGADSNVVLGAGSSLLQDLNVTGALTLNQANNPLLGSYSLIANSIALTTGAVVVAQTLKTKTSELTVITTGATALTTINNTSDALELSTVTMSAAGLSLTQTGDLTHTGAVTAAAAAPLTLSVNGTTFVDGGTLDGVSVFTFTGNMDSKSVFAPNATAAAVPGVETLALTGTVGRFALDNGAKAITVNAFKGQATSSVSVTTTGANDITLAGKLDTLASLTLSAVGGTFAFTAGSFKENLANIGSLGLTVAADMTVGPKGEVGFAGAAGVKLADFGSKNLTLTSAGLVTVTALAAATDSYDFSGVDSFTLGGGFVDAAAPATNAVNFSKITGLKSFGVKNTTAGTAITVALDDLANGLAASSSAGLLTVSHLTAIQVAGFSGAGTLAFDGAATTAQASDIAAGKISALGSVTALTLTNSDVAALNSLTTAVATGTAGKSGVASLATLNFNTTASTDLTNLAVAGATALTLTATATDSTVTAGSDKDDSAFTGVLNQPTVANVSIYANTHNLSGFTMASGASVVAALNAGKTRATSATYKLDSGSTINSLEIHAGKIVAQNDNSSNVPVLTYDGALSETGSFTPGQNSVSDSFTMDESDDLASRLPFLAQTVAQGSALIIGGDTFTTDEANTLVNNSALVTALKADVAAKDSAGEAFTMKTATDAILAVGNTTNAAVGEASMTHSSVQVAQTDVFHVAAFNTDLVTQINVVDFMNMVTRGGTFVAPVAAVPVHHVAHKAKVTVEADHKAEHKAEEKKAKAKTTKAKVAATAASAKDAVVDAAVATKDAVVDAAVAAKAAVKAN